MQQSEWPSQEMNEEEREGEFHQKTVGGRLELLLRWGWIPPSVTLFFKYRVISLHLR